MNSSWFSMASCLRINTPAIASSNCRRLRRSCPAFLRLVKNLFARDMKLTLPTYFHLMWNLPSHFSSILSHTTGDRQMRHCTWKCRECPFTVVAATRTDWHGCNIDIDRAVHSCHNQSLFGSRRPTTRPVFMDEDSNDDTVRHTCYLPHLLSHFNCSLTHSLAIISSLLLLHHLLEFHFFYFFSANSFYKACYHTHGWGFQRCHGATHLLSYSLTHSLNYSLTHSLLFLHYFFCIIF